MAHTIAQILAAAREQSDLSQYQAADASGISRGYISRLKAGLVLDPSLSTLTALARAYGLTVGEMLGEYPEK